jgi:hypothetical protein
MRQCPFLLVGLYERALRLCPRAYRAEYGLEMAWVFGQAVEEACVRGTASLAAT